MNWIGFKHLVLHRVEQFLFLFVRCKHHITIGMSDDEMDDLELSAKMGAGIAYTVCCDRCDKPIKVYICRPFDPPVLHRCKYCNVMTAQPDSECWNSPDKHHSV